MKILIVEDETDLLIRISNYLTKENYICELADNFQKASEKIAIYEVLKYKYKHKIMVSVKQKS